jgi:superfamily II DNA/RNA helicase
VSQAARESVLADFRAGTLRVMVATDVAARGIDVPGVEIVLQTLPQDFATYIHRAGRTGRAGKKGTTVLFYHPNERSEIPKLARAAGIKFEQCSPK